MARMNYLIVRTIYFPILYRGKIKKQAPQQKKSGKKRKKCDFACYLAKARLCISQMDTDE
jgi:hypothetical protein